MRPSERGGIREGSTRAQRDAGQASQSGNRSAAAAPPAPPAPPGTADEPHVQAAMTLNERARLAADAKNFGAVWDQSDEFFRQPGVPPQKSTIQAEAAQKQSRREEWGGAQVCLGRQRSWDESGAEVE